MNSFPDETRNLLSLFMPVREENDRTIWSASPSGMFSVSSAYNLLLGTSPANFNWNLVWKKTLPPRIKFFLWLVVHNRLLTREVCVRRHIPTTAHCPRCDDPCESILHLLRDCQESQVIWSSWLQGRRLDYFNSLPFDDWLRVNFSNSSFIVANNIPWADLFCYTCWYIWRWRNCCVF